MACTIKLIALRVGWPDTRDGQYVVEYEPPAMDAHGEYLPGGKLATTRNIAKAKRFTDKIEAVQYWQMQNGLRQDGEPNRPLTAWTVEISDLDV